MEVPVSQEKLIELLRHGIKHGAFDAIVPTVEQWTLGACVEIVRLREENEKLKSQIREQEKQLCPTG